MSKKVSKKRSKLEGWIYVRYWLSVLVVLCMVITMFIPCLRYTTAQTGTNDTISAAELMKNTWDNVRMYLFGTSNPEANTLTFSRVTLVLLILCIVLFLVGAVAAVWSAIGAVQYFRNPEDRSAGRILYMTLFPNRIATVVWQATVLPLLAFPRILILCYEKILHVGVLLNVTFPEPLVIGGILFALLVIVTIATRSLERRKGMDPFKKRISRVVVLDREEDEPEEKEPTFATEAERQYYEMNKRAREEQAERIRQLLRTSTEQDEEQPKE